MVNGGRATRRPDLSGAVDEEVGGLLHDHGLVRITTQAWTLGNSSRTSYPGAELVARGDDGPSNLIGHRAGGTVLEVSQMEAKLQYPRQGCSARWSPRAPSSSVLRPAVQPRLGAGSWAASVSMVKR